MISWIVPLNFKNIFFKNYTYTLLLNCKDQDMVHYALYTLHYNVLVLPAPLCCTLYNILNQKTKYCWCTDSAHMNIILFIHMNVHLRIVKKTQTQVEPACKATTKMRSFNLYLIILFQ